MISTKKSVFSSYQKILLIKKFVRELILKFFRVRFDILESSVQKVCYSSNVFYRGKYAF